MFKDLVEQLVKLKEGVFLPNAFNISQDPKKKLLIWYYNLATEQFEYSTTAINHSEIVREKGLFLDNNWVKGRVFKHNGHIYLIAYITTFLHNPITLNHLIKITQKIKRVFREPIEYFVDDTGYRIDEKVSKK
jgi:hypothetical protein